EEILVQSCFEKDEIDVWNAKSTGESRGSDDGVRSESEKTSGSTACWSGVAGAAKDSNGWWVGVCGEALGHCGGTPVMVEMQQAEEKVAPAVDFSRSGGNGYAAEKARCTVFDEVEEDLVGAVSEVFERLGLPVPVVVSEPEGLSLVNVENYVRGVVDDFDTTVELLDQQVRITAHPVVWSWDMGDGTTYERTAGSGGFPDG